MITQPKKRGPKYKQAKQTHTQMKKRESNIIGVTYYNQANRSKQHYKM